MKPRVVFDCMIFLQAAVSSTGPAAACLGRAEADDVELLISDGVLAEVRDVLNRPRSRKRFRNLTPELAAGFIARVERVAVLIEPVPMAFTLTRDPKDSKYLNLAIAGGAKLIVSRDSDLLDLMTSTDAEPTAFRTTYPNIRIVEPVVFLQSLRQPNPPSPPTAINP